MREIPAYRNGGFYHLYNRGVEKRRIFSDDKDRLRFIHDLFEFNDENIIQNSTFYHANHYQGVVPEKERKPRKLLVDILAYALMPNHYHLLVRQRKANGVSLFARKLGAGYTGYFNMKHQRVGALFQGSYRAKEIAEDQYLRHLLMYIHLNPLKLFRETSKENGVNRRLDQLEQYRWSSYCDYLGLRNFPSVINLDLSEELALPKGKVYRKEILLWLHNSEHYLETIRDLTLDSL